MLGTVGTVEGNKLFSEIIERKYVQAGERLQALINIANAMKDKGYDENDGGLSYQIEAAKYYLNLCERDYKTYCRKEA